MTGKIYRERIFSDGGIDMKVCVTLLADDVNTRYDVSLMSLVDGKWRDLADLGKSVAEDVRFEIDTVKRMCWKAMHPNYVPEQFTRIHHPHERTGKDMQWYQILDYKTFYNYTKQGGTLNSRDKGSYVYIKENYPIQCKELEEDVDKNGFDWSAEVEKHREKK